MFFTIIGAPQAQPSENFFDCIEHTITQDLQPVLREADAITEEVIKISSAIAEVTENPLAKRIAEDAAQADKMIGDAEKIDEDIIAGKSAQADIEKAATDGAGLISATAAKEVQEAETILNDAEKAALDLENGNVVGIAQDIDGAIDATAALTGNPVVTTAAHIADEATQVIVRIIGADTKVDAKTAAQQAEIAGWIKRLEARSFERIEAATTCWICLVA